MRLIVAFVLFVIAPPTMASECKGKSDCAACRTCRTCKWCANPKNQKCHVFNAVRAKYIPPPVKRAPEKSVQNLVVRR